MRRLHRAATMASLGIQPAGLKVGAANDKYEKEADKVAEHVVNSPGPAGGGISAGAGGAQRAPRSGGRNLEVDRDEDANILTKRLQRGVQDATDDVTDDEKQVANASPLERMIGRDASETQAQRTVDPEDPEGKINKKPIDISRMPGAKGDEETDAMKMHDDAGYRAGEPSASEMGQRMPEEEAASESDSEMMDGQTSRLQRMGEDDLQEKPMAQRDAMKGYDDEAKMKPLAQRECATCGQEAKRTVQRRGKARDGAFTASKDVSRNVGEMRRSGGRPLPEAERAYLEPRFGRDLSHVRIHTDDRAARTSQAIQAKAFTVANNIAFNKGYYRPGTHAGRKLLAHEITHTIQQTGGRKKGAGGKARGAGRVSREVVQRQVTPGSGRRYLRSFLKMKPTEVLDSEIQRTEEYKSYVAPGLVWKLSNTEALYACRLILAQMRAGNRVNWTREARKFAAEARRVNKSHTSAMNSADTGRGLTTIEISEARKVFGDSIDYSKVKLEFDSTIAEAGAIINGGGSMGVTLFNTIKFNRKISTGPGTWDMAWLIHELTHVAQAAKTGATYIFQAVWAQWTEGYDYDPARLRTHKFRDFNREQQGEIASDYYIFMLYKNRNTRLAGFTRADFLPRIIELRNGDL